MSNTRVNRFGRPVLFRSKERGFSNKTFTTGSIKNIYDTNIRSEDSFKYDPYGSAMKSTQQLSVDFSKFENHTFFNSAVSKITVAFNKFINKFPFDGKLSEIEDFEDKLTGYEKYILNNIDKYTGYLTVTGSSYIEVVNIAGNNFPEFSSNKTGNRVLNPGKDSFSIEMFVAIPDEAHSEDMQMFYMSGSNTLIEAKINKSLLSDSHCSASFRLVSGSSVDISINTDSFQKGQFNHISFVVDKLENEIKSFVNSEKQTSSSIVNIDDMNLNNNLFLCKSGYYYDGYNFENTSNFSGSIKDVRLYHHPRNSQRIKDDYMETIYKNDFLKLNFRFNEPTGSFTVNEYVLDTSGNSLHSKITNEDTGNNSWIDDIRSFLPYSNPVINENKARSHILFPDYPTIVDYHQSLIVSGSEYDLINPNLITKLIPPHYYEEPAFDSGNTDEQYDFKKRISGNSIPGSADNIKTSILNVLLFSWANIFDEIKMFIDSFGNVIFSDYRDEDIVPDQMIVFAAKHLGIDLPPIFTNNFSNNFVDSKSIYYSNSIDNLPVKRIQSLIWKRIMADASYYRKTKGTIESLKTMFRSSGINPDKMFAFVEKGSNSQYLSDENNETKSVDIALFNFSGSNANVSEGTLDENGTSLNKPNLITSHLSSSDYGYFTKDSWTFEGYYSFPTNIASGSKESLCRIIRVNPDLSDYSDGDIGGILNIVATKQTTTSLTGSLDSVSAVFTDDLNAEVSRSISINNTNIFDGDLWYVSFSKHHEDNEENLSILTGSTYELKCYKCGTDNQKFSQSKILTGSTYDSIQNDDNISMNGPIAIIGSQSLDFTQKYGIFNLDSSDENHSLINETNFTGRVAAIRFYTQFLFDDESINHSRDYRNYGIRNPNIDSMFLTGSENKIRLNIMADTPVTSSSDSEFVLIDLTQREKNFNESDKTKLSGFETNKSFNYFEKFSQIVTSNKIDEINSKNKIRIRSLEENPDFNLGYQSLAPVYGNEKYDEISDDARFSIEMSIARIINEKINNEVSGVSFFENILGRKNQDFSLRYHELDYFSDNFFNNIEEDIKIDKILNVYTWLESSFESILEKSLPKKTKFLGMNYVVEPHNLERSKIIAKNENAYMVGETNNEVRTETTRIQVYEGEISPI